MAEFPSLAALRSGLTTDDADERGRAYGAVLGAEGDIQPSDVLASDPSEETVSALEDAGVLPENSGGRPRRPVDERDEEIVELLREIRDILEGA